MPAQSKAVTFRGSSKSLITRFQNGEVCDSAKASCPLAAPARGSAPPERHRQKSPLGRAVIDTKIDRNILVAFNGSIIGEACRNPYPHPLRGTSTGFVILRFITLTLGPTAAWRASLKSREAPA